MLRRHHQDQFIFKHGSDAQTFIPRGAAHDGHIETACEQCGGGICRRLSLDINLYIRKLAVKFLEQWWQPVIARVALRAKPEYSASAATQALDLRFGTRQFAQYVLCAR